jgi:hypothetical protein
MLRRVRGASGRGRNPSVHWGRLTLNLIWLLVIFGLFTIGALKHPSAPLQIHQAFSHGVQYVTSNHLTPGLAMQWAILALTLISTRWVYLELRAYMGTGIEVRPVDNSSGCRVDTHPLDAAFREYMALPKLYQLTTIPGDPEPDHLVEVLRVPSAAGWRGLLAAALAYTFPRRAFIVSASLRKQDHNPKYGAAVQVRRLPGLATELETQWSTSFERALQRAAYAAVAHILPQTKACRSTPWHAWQTHILPTSLFRNYQRAKKMVAERRYDEALNLYHQALIQDANNIDMRYDVGQLYERLGLYPDALYTYLTLVDQLFPYKSSSRRARSRRSSMGKRDPFVIWYRYTVVLALAAPLARELLYPDWESLRDWLIQASQRADGLEEERPLRTLQLLDTRRLLAGRLSEIYPVCAAPSKLKIPFRRLLENPANEGALRERITLLERCLLTYAECEAARLAHSMKWSVRRYLTPRRPNSLTLTVVRQMQFGIRYRLALLNQRSGRGNLPRWARSPKDIESKLRKAGYNPQKSTNWLEHYNAACTYALVMRDDTKEMEPHLPYAYAAVSALELALRYGEDVDFVRTKRYWLQAGDPDLAGLRNYTCFRAFETRIYGRPLPSTMNIVKYELYLYLRAVLEDGTGHLEREWRKRATYSTANVSTEVLEEWWRQERHAWELAIRLGRFYRQWQTRRDAVEGRRNWIESFGQEARPVPYPNVDQPTDLPDIGDFKTTHQILEETERIFDYLGNDCGRLMPSKTEAASPSIMAKTRRWSDYAARCAQSVPRGGLMNSDVVEACEMRAAVWAALRHWAHDPSFERKRRFAEAVKKLKDPPAVDTA